LQQLPNRLVEPAKILIVVGIAYTLATTGWYVISGPTPAPLAAPGVIKSGSSPAQTWSVAQIAAQNLFGQTAGPTAAPAAYDAPETRMNLTLEGIFVAEDPTDSAAIISQQGRPSELIVVGGKVAGATLTEVHADRVVLKRGGTFETLRFPDQPTLLSAQERAGAAMQSPNAADYFGGTSPPGDNVSSQPDDVQPQYEDEAPTADAGAVNSSQSVASIVQTYRDRLQSDPVGTLHSLGVSPVANDAAQGYRLDSIANSPYLAQTGLQPGDVILSVNGRPVGDVQQDHMEIDNVLAQGSARLEVQRGNRRFFVTASLK
jgi:general secretion pathway protein C